MLKDCEVEGIEFFRVLTCDQKVGEGSVILSTTTDTSRKSTD